MDKIVTKPSNETYREGWERIFGKKKQKHNYAIKKLEVTVNTTCVPYHTYSRQMDQPYPRKCIKCDHIETEDERNG